MLKKNYIRLLWKPGKNEKARQGYKETTEKAAHFSCGNRLFVKLTSFRQEQMKQEFSELWSLIPPVDIKTQMDKSELDIFTAADRNGGLFTWTKEYFCILEGNFNLIKLVFIISYFGFHRDAWICGFSFGFQILEAGICMEFYSDALSESVDQNGHT